MAVEVFSRNELLSEFRIDPFNHLVEMAVILACFLASLLPCFLALAVFTILKAHK